MLFNVTIILIGLYMPSYKIERSVNVQPELKLKTYRFELSVKSHVKAASKNFLVLATSLRGVLGDLALPPKPSSWEKIVARTDWHGASANWNHFSIVFGRQYSLNWSASIEALNQAVDPCHALILRLLTIFNFWRMIKWSSSYYVQTFKFLLAAFYGTFSILVNIEAPPRGEMNAFEN